MNKIVLLDSGPLGMITHPRKNLEIKLWLQNLLNSKINFRVPEIADYEVRRELLRANKIKGIQRLDNLISQIGLLPITREVMLQAAEFWAETRKQGQPTTDDKSLDGDVILAAQALTISRDNNEVVIATTNVKHLNRFVTAKQWHEIS